MKTYIALSPLYPAVVSVVFALTAACSQRAAPPAEIGPVTNNQGKLYVPDASALRKQLVVQAVQVRTAPHALNVPATVDADPAHTIAVLPPATGRVVELKVSLGSRVAKGEVLMTIASGDSAQAYTDVNKAHDALALSKKQLDRARAVQNVGGEATKDIEAAVSAVNQAQAEYDRASARLSSFGGASGKGASARTIAVIAPMAGNIIALDVAPGQFINDSTVTTMTLSNIDNVFVTANVPENEVGRIAPGQNVDITLPAFPDEVLHGTVASIDNVLTPDTRRQKVHIAFANMAGKLIPNMFATVTFQVPQQAQVFVPQSALLMNNDNVTVFVETAPWTFERRNVTLGYDEGDDARVTRGLAAGDRVVVKGAVLIND